MAFRPLVQDTSTISVGEARYKIAKLSSVMVCPPVNLAKREFTIFGRGHECPFLPKELDVVNKSGSGCKIGGSGHQKFHCCGKGVFEVEGHDSKECCFVNKNGIESQLEVTRDQLIGIELQGPKNSVLICDLAFFNIFKMLLGSALFYRVGQFTRQFMRWSMACLNWRLSVCTSERTTSIANPSRPPEISALGSPEKFEIKESRLEVVLLVLRSKLVVEYQFFTFILVS